MKYFLLLLLLAGCKTAAPQFDALVPPTKEAKLVWEYLEYKTNITSFNVYSATNINQFTLVTNVITLWHKIYLTNAHKFFTVKTLELGLESK